MLQRAAIAATLTLLGLAASTGVSEASKGPDAQEVAIGTVVVIAIMMGALLLLYGIKVALGGDRPLPPEEPAAADHH